MSSLHEPGALSMLGARVAAPYRLTKVFQRDLGRWLFPAAMVKTVVDPVVSILIGALAFAEGIETSATAIILEVLSLLTMTVGVFLLARSPLVSQPDDEMPPTPTHPVPVRGGPGG